MQTVTTAQRRTAEDHFEVVVRLRQSANGQGADATQRLRAQALLKDILMSRLEVEAEINAQESVHTRGFGDLGRALAASRALQLAFEGFRTAVPAARANVSVVLDSSAPDETVTSNTGLSVEQKDLLNLAKPSQVLITQAFYDRIAVYQPPLRSSTLRAGVYEFLWTTEQRLNELQAEAEFMPTLIQPSPVVDLAATVIVPAIKSAPVSRWKEPDPTYTPAPAPVFDDPAPGKQRSTSRIFVIGIAIVLLCVVGYLVRSLVFGNPSRPSPQVTQTEKPTPVRQSPVTPPPAEPKPLVPAGSPTVQAHTVSPPVVVKPPKPTVAVSDGISSSQQSGSKAAARSRNCTLEADEIPRYLNLAENNSSQGRYERAISEYNLVLGCQPGNRSAQDGLRRAQDAEKYSSR
jgi:hypothetical protein